MGGSCSCGLVVSGQAREVGRTTRSTNSPRCVLPIGSPESARTIG